MIKFHQAQNRHIESIIIARLRRKRLGKIPLDRDSNPRPCAPSFWPRWFVVALASDASGFGLPASPAPWCSSWVVGRMHRDLAVAFLGFGVTKPNPVLHIHLNSTGPTARLTARRYRARFTVRYLLLPNHFFLQNDLAYFCHPSESVSIVFWIYHHVLLQ